MTTEEIQEMIQEALIEEAKVHKKETKARETAMLEDFEDRLQAATAVSTPPGSHTSSTSPVRRTSLLMGSSICYNGLGGTSTSAISQAATKRTSTLASAASASSSSPSTSVEEDYYKTFSVDQTKIKESLN